MNDDMAIYGDCLIEISSMKEINNKIPINFNFGCFYRMGEDVLVSPRPGIPSKNENGEIIRFDANTLKIKGVYTLNHTGTALKTCRLNEETIATVSYDENEVKVWKVEDLIK